MFQGQLKAIVPSLCDGPGTPQWDMLKMFPGVGGQWGIQAPKLAWLTVWRRSHSTPRWVSSSPCFLGSAWRKFTSETNSPVFGFSCSFAYVPNFINIFISTYKCSGCLTITAIPIRISHSILTMLPSTCTIFLFSEFLPTL